MKQRFTALDVAAVVRELQSLLIPNAAAATTHPGTGNDHSSDDDDDDHLETLSPLQSARTATGVPRQPSYRLQNLYDVNQKTYLLKFARPESKLYLLVESGVRIHTTEFTREKQNTQLPNGFCMKLRKHLRTKRLAAVQQLGKDRIVQLTFGGGESAYHVFCEFYASGNLVLTDHQYTIIALLRVVQPEEGVRFAVGEKYPANLAREPSLIAEGRLVTALGKSNKKDQVKKAMLMQLDYAPVLVEHCCLVINGEIERQLRESNGTISDIVQPNDRCSTLFDSSGNLVAGKFARLLTTLQMADQITTELSPTNPNFQSIASTSADSLLKGYIFGVSGADNTTVVYEEFHPFPFKQLIDKYPNYQQYDSFNQACDQYFTAIESQRIEAKARQQEETALRKLENVRLEHEGRLKGLAESQMTNDNKARLIELNLDMVEKCILTVRGAIASGMDWIELGRLVEEERRRGNPVALHIARLKLEFNQITLSLGSDQASDSGDYDDEEYNDTESVETKAELVDVDIGLTAFANARRYYDMRKVSAKKQDKTVQASKKALRSAEMKIQREMKETKVSIAINKIRKPFWFEKFQWFISTENYLVISGRDAQQNEYLVKRHLRKGDVYVHADITGSSSVIIKNPSGQPIPPSTLSQAGSMAIVYSRAWEAKIVTSAYWVHHDQVSKTAPSGEYLTTGSFMVRGKKNYLPPTPLLFGFGILFRVADECVPNHMHERRPHLRGANDGDSQESIGETSVTGDFNQLASIESINSIDDGDNNNCSIDGGDDAEEEVAVAGSSSTDSSTSSDSDESEPESEKRKISPAVSKKTAVEAVADKYNLQDFGSSSEAEELPSNQESSADINHPSSVAPARKYVSAKQRRRLKKGVTADEVEEQEDVSNFNKPEDLPASSQKQQPHQQKQVRGKKNKLKRLERYKEQDEEDRKLRMQLLGTTEMKQPSFQSLEQQQQAESEKVVAKDRVSPKSEKQGQNQGTGKQSKPDKKAPKMINLPGTVEDNETAEINRLLGEENLLPPDEDDPATLVDTLTGNPLTTDTILFAVPTCAPLATIQSYKYRVKLIPGAMKKGKASRAAISHFTAQSDNPAEKAVMKAITEPELIQTMLGKVKVMLSGGDSGGGSSKKRKK